MLQFLGKCSLFNLVNVLTLSPEWLGAPADHPHFSILLHSAHAKAPPAYIQVAGFDPLRDEGILYAKVLEEAGVKVQCDVYVTILHLRSHRMRLFADRSVPVGMPVCLMGATKYSLHSMSQGNSKQISFRICHGFSKVEK